MPIEFMYNGELQFLVRVDTRFSQAGESREAVVEALSAMADQVIGSINGLFAQHTALQPTTTVRVLFDADKGGFAHSWPVHVQGSAICESSEPFRVLFAADDESCEFPPEMRAHLLDRAAEAMNACAGLDLQFAGLSSLAELLRAADAAYTAYNDPSEDYDEVLHSKMAQLGLRLLRLPSVARLESELGQIIDELLGSASDEGCEDTVVVDAAALNNLCIALGRAERFSVREETEE